MAEESGATSGPHPLPQPHRKKAHLAPEDDVLPRTPPRQDHHISESKRTWLNAMDLPNDFPNDSALENFLPELKSHLLGRLLGIPYEADESIFDPRFGRCKNENVEHSTASSFCLTAADSDSHG
ncbi:hypothetical protein C8R46DRAFT_1030706 [Mycena filopes]|nr:hypothetical protein C8R46DRAFT_1030706 [Mycena filopes]